MATSLGWEPAPWAAQLMAGYQGHGGLANVRQCYPLLAKAGAMAQSFRAAPTAVRLGNRFQAGKITVY